MVHRFLSLIILLASVALGATVTVHFTVTDSSGVGFVGATVTGISPNTFSGITPPGQNGLISFDIPSANPQKVSFSMPGYGVDTVSYNLSFTRSITHIIKLSQTINLNPQVVKNYGDGSFSLPATASSGLPLSYSCSPPSVASLSGNTITINGVGRAIIGAWQTGSDYYKPILNPVNETLTVQPKALTITADSKTKVVGSSDPSLTASYSGFISGENASNLSGTLTFTRAPGEVAGSYAITPSGLTSSNYNITYVLGTLVISKAPATVTLGNLTATYNGNSIVITATTIPANLSVGLTYDGSSTAPTNAGSYSVTGTINDANYQGSASGTLVINKASATVTLGSLTAVYDGTVKSATASTTPAGLTVNLSYSSSPVNVGSYTVTGTISDVNYIGSATGTLVINKATATVTLSSLIADYNGSPKVVTATTVPAGLPVTVTYSGSSTAPTNAGSYTVLATATDGIYQGSASGMLVISRIPQSITFGALSDKAYNDGQFNLTATANSGLPVMFSSSNNSIAVVAGDTVTITGAGLDTITAIQNGGTNYLPAVSLKQVLRVIGKPVFTSPDSITVKGGVIFSYKVVYQIPGNPLTHKDTILMKPSWLNVVGDSLYGTIPKVNRNDTVKVQISIGNVSSTLVLVLHIKTSTGTLIGMSAVKANPYKVVIYDLSGRVVQKTTTQNLQNILRGNSSYLSILKVTRNNLTVRKKSLRIR